VCGPPWRPRAQFFATMNHLLWGDTRKHLPVRRATTWRHGMRSHPGESGHRVMTTRPVPLQAGLAERGRVMQPTVYRIQVWGRLTERFESALEGMRLQPGEDTSAFVGEVRDQSQLYGLLDRLRDLGFELVSLEPYSSAQPPDDDGAPG
jgi:hypothetical protein